MNEIGLGWGLSGMIASLFRGLALGVIFAMQLSAVFSVIILVSKKESAKVAE